MSGNLKSQMLAYTSLTELLEKAEATRVLFEQARAPMPPVLLQMFSGTNGHSASGALAPVAPFRPSAPPDADLDWIWVKIKTATNGTLALAVLKTANTTLTVREIHEKMRALGVDVVTGTIANTGTRALENDLISRDDEGRWTLLQTDRAPIIYEDYLWGPPQAFQMQEQAAYRRHAVVYLLRQNTVGLQQSQIEAMLRQSELVRPPVPLSKSLLKMDLMALKNEGKARRIGNSKKWEATEPI